MVEIHMKRRPVLPMVETELRNYRDGLPDAVDVDVAEMLEDIQAELRRLRDTLSAITARDAYSHDEVIAMARAALKLT